MEVTIEITQWCDRGCPYCSSNATEGGKHLSYHDIHTFLQDVYKKHGISRINISGGEPLAHPDFYIIKRLCDKLCDEVWVYTNAIQNIIFNADCMKEVRVHANVCMTAGDKYIPKNVEQVHLLKAVHKGRAKDMELPNIKASGNFFEGKHGGCSKCEHALLQADGKIVEAPCKKDYQCSIKQQ